MKILIDTQVLVWLTNQDQNLGKYSLALLGDTSNEVFLSYFSLFEIVIKTSIGKMAFNKSLVEDLPKMGIELLMPDLESLYLYKAFNKNNKDPFDNILLSTAISQKCFFMTSDKKLLAIKTGSLKRLNAST